MKSSKRILPGLALWFAAAVALALAAFAPLSGETLRALSGTAALAAMGGFAAKCGALWHA